jgi:F0F1-type ATP synthase assembly protein I
MIITIVAMSDDNANQTSKLARLYQIGQVGTEMAIPVGLGFALDYFLNTLPWFTVIGAILGPVLGFWHLLVILRTPLPDDEKKP